MANPTDPVYAARSAIAIYSRKGRYSNPAKVAEARRALAVAKMERSIRDTIAAVGTLTSEERTSAVTLLMSSADAA